MRFLREKWRPCCLCGFLVLAAGGLLLCSSARVLDGAFPSRGFFCDTPADLLGIVGQVWNTRGVDHNKVDMLPGVKGRQAQHLTTLAAFICAIVASGSTQLPKVANGICDGAAPPSREKRKCLVVKS